MLKKIRERENEVIPLVKWKKQAKPKEEGGWSLKNKGHFLNYFSMDRERENEVIPLVKWKKQAKPKEEGGWSLKNIHLFGPRLLGAGSGSGSGKHIFSKISGSGSVSGAFFI
jgi:hypothetical protein